MGKQKKASKKPELRELTELELDILMHFYYNVDTETFPEPTVENLAPSALRKEGFLDVLSGDWSRVILETFPYLRNKGFRKTFSGVLDLCFASLGKNRWRYWWVMNDEKFEGMNRELRGLNELIGREASAIYRLCGAKTRRPGWDDKYRSMINDAVPRVKTAINRFVSKYKDFLDITRRPGYRKPYVGRERFFFDACTSKKQLNLYFRFIELYFDVFIGTKHAKRHTARFTPEVMRVAMVLYHAMRKAVREIRKLDRDGARLHELKQKYHMLPVGAVEAIAGYIDGDKEFAGTPSNIAYEYVAKLLRTTRKNLKKEFNKKRPLFREADKVTDQPGQVEEALTLHAGSLSAHPSLQLAFMTTDMIPEEDWIGWTRWMLVQKSSSQN